MITRPRPLEPPTDPFVRSVLFADLGVVPAEETLIGANWTIERVNEFGRARLGSLAASFLETHVSSPDAAVRRLAHNGAITDATGVAWLLQRSARAFELLRTAGIAMVAIKGVPAVSLYPSNAPRYMGDVDILIETTDFERAFFCLKTEGGRLYGGKEGFYLHTSPSLNVTDDAGLQVDLHRALAPWRWTGGLTFERLSAGSSIVSLAGSEIRATNVVHSLLITACSIVSDCGTAYQKVLPWRDVALLLRTIQAEQSTEELIREAIETDTGWMLRSVLAALPPELRPTSLIARLPSASRGQRRFMRLAHDPRIATKSWGMILFRWPLRRAIAFERGMFWPSRSEVHDRGYASRTSFIRGLIHEFRSN